MVDAMHWICVKGYFSVTPINCGDPYSNKRRHNKQNDGMHLTADCYYLTFADAVCMQREDNNEISSHEKCLVHVDGEAQSSSILMLRLRRMPVWGK